MNTRRIAAIHRERAELLDEMKTRPWHVPDAYGLVLTDPREVPFTPWTGMLGLFDVPDSVAGPLVQRAA